MELEVHRVDRHDAVATFGPVVFRVVRTATTELADIDEAKAIMSAAFARYADVGALVVVEHGAPTPSGDVRRYGQQVFGEFGDHLIMCHVALGLGFWASTARLAIRAITRLTGAPALMAGSVEEGAQRLATELIGVDPDKLVWVYEELSRLIDAERAKVA